MLRVRFALLALAALALLGLPAPVVHAEDDPAAAAAAAEAKAAAAFEKGLIQVQGCYKRGRSEKGLKQLGSLLAKHERKPYVIGRRAVLADLARRLAFDVKYDLPTADDVMLGKVTRWEPAKGRIKIYYKREQALRFRREGTDVQVFPADTRGPFMLQLWGRYFPSTPRDCPWMKFVGDEDPTTKKRHAFDVIFGSPRQTIDDREVWMPASITHTHGKSSKKVSERDEVSARIGKPYKMELKVTEKEIVAGLNGKIVAKAKKPKDMWGWVGFTAPSWETLIFTGYIEPAYVQERIDRALQRHLDEFRKTYKRTDHLPTWLFEADGTKPAVTVQELPIEPEKKHWPAVRLAKRRIKNQEWTELAKQLATIRADGVPGPVVDWLEAQMLAAQGDDAAALEVLDRCLKDHPDFLKGQLLRGQTLGRLRRADDAFTTFQRALTEHPDDPSAYEAATVAMLLAGRPDAAQKIAESAARRGVVSRELDQMSLVIVKALTGPQWPETYEHKSRNYHVFSNISKTACVEASKLLEQALTSYKVNFRWVSRDKSRLFHVYLFSGQVGFMQYVADLEGLMGTPNERVAGLYSPILKQLLIWNLPDKKDMLETVRHEGFHQYLDRFLADVPIWINEGLAVYHENARSVRGSLKFGDVHAYHLALLREKGFVPLEEFVVKSPAEFYEGGLRSYAQAWALVHFFKHGPSQYRKVFKQVVEDMHTLSATDVLAKHFSKDKLTKLEPDFRKYVRGLKP